MGSILAICYGCNRPERIGIACRHFNVDHRSNSRSSTEDTYVSSGSERHVLGIISMQRSRSKSDYTRVYDMKQNVAKVTCAN
ncbi:hypothetical protein VTN02DRAFT_5926 [Thermoascus thermophilus]